MIRDDARSRRVAIVPDYLVNPGSALYAGLPRHPPAVADLLVEDGWGLMKPPPHVVGPGIGRPAIDLIAGDAVDYRRHGHDVVILAVEGLPAGGVWLDLLEAAFHALAEPTPPILRITPTDSTDAIRAALRDTLATGART